MESKARVNGSMLAGKVGQEVVVVGKVVSVSTILFGGVFIVVLLTKASPAGGFEVNYRAFYLYPGLRNVPLPHRLHTTQTTNKCLNSLYNSMIFVV